jgi:hypothetical protein
LPGRFHTAWKEALLHSGATWPTRRAACAPPPPQAIADNPDSDFLTDPNGFVVPVARQAADVVAEQARRKAEAAAALDSSGAGLFDRLMQTASGGGRGRGAPERAAPRAASYLPGSMDSQDDEDGVPASRGGGGSSRGAAASGAGGVGARRAAADPGLALAKSSFLMAHQQQYGYQGLIDKLYASEVGCR